MRRIAFFLYSLSGGGTEKVNLSLAGELSQMGYLVDLILVRKDGELIEKVNSNIRIIDLHKIRAIGCIYNLVKYIIEEKPEIVFTAFPTINVIGIFANILACFKTNVIPTEHMPVSIDAKENSNIEPRIAYKLYPFLYFFAKKIVLISEDAIKDFTKKYKLINKKKISLIYNPVVSDDLLALSREVPADLWLKQTNDKAPIIIGVGRLTELKNFQLLIQAFAKLRDEGINCRLAILGKGDEYNNLICLAKKLKVTDNFFLPGFKKNPYSYIAQAAVFVLSSNYETLPTVVIEALACGTPVVATDCFGVKEILQNGEYGVIVENATVNSMADAIKKVLMMPVDKKKLMERAKFFNVHSAAKKYSKLIEEISFKP